MPTALKLSGTSFNQETIKTLNINDPVIFNIDAEDDVDSEIEDLDGGNNDPAIKCLNGDRLIGYIPKEHKKRIRQLIKEGKEFKIYKLNTYKDNPIIGVRIISS